MSPNDEFEFQRITRQGFAPETRDPLPYGNSPHHPKTGLTPRGKAALAFGGAALAATALVGWSVSSSNAAEAEQKAMEIALKRDQLELEKLKVVNQVSTQAAKTQATLDAARQVKVDACVKANKTLVGKQLGATYSSVLEDCQDQYQSTTEVGMQAAGASTGSPDGAPGGGEVNSGFLIGGVALAGLMAVGARKARRNAA
ncbi:hypothetical protein P1P75_40935 [Streptomyces sp. ID05-39B]|uniref:hypothetical protein n=1 Tax=Streptomyces sp. ID05-39B TaxID=3028664 RepID=UPI0029AE5E55|nr:hypothetical protein [Streptomyces sp. ID05-39B]MDX3532594.1 hypothetical protein [Streptomyces sp. ID05-39B]